MPPCTIQKYGFRIRTRSGVIVENLSIHGGSEADARRKLCQMYNDCEILEMRSQQVPVGGRSAAFSYEDVVDLIVTGG
jgi:hypothetical protein